MQANRCTALLALSVLLAACSGGGGGGGGGDSPSPPATYTVGGSISGLTASGLVLLDNGGNALDVATGATSFQFSTALANDSAYAVTVQTQPTDETCSVSIGSGNISSANVSNVSVSCAFSGLGANVVAMSVNPGPASPGYQTFNIPLTTVTVCLPNSNTCGQISNVVVDTGSSGLRIMASVLAAAGLTLTPISDPNNPPNTIYECLPFADAYTWGAVASAGVQISGESATSAISIQIIDDNGTPPAAPGTCTSRGNSLNSVNAFDANGVLGVGLFVQDCGIDCAQSASYDVYWSCTSAGSCTPTTLVSADQVSNPVASFANDNNGVILQLPPIASTGAPTATGYLVFGIGTAANNGLDTTNVLSTNALGNFTTSFDNQTLTNSFIDSGSNELFFPDSSITPCAAPAQAIYCPGSASSLSLTPLQATNQGANGTMSVVSFQIANLDYLAANDSSNFALDDIGGPTNLKTLSSYFDWGMPFLYGRTLYVAIEGAMAAGTAGPYYAY